MDDAPQPSTEPPAAIPDGGSRPPTPRWVFVLGAIAVILILAVAAQLVIGTEHGPGLHGAT